MGTLDRYVQAQGSGITQLVYQVNPETGEYELVSEGPVGAGTTAQRIDWFTEPGGMIVVSTDVNAAVAGADILTRVKAWFESQKNRFTYKSRTKEVVDWVNVEREQNLGLHSRIVFSFGPGLFSGRYKDDESGQIFDERSFSIDIRGIPFDEIVSLGRLLGSMLRQKSVLVVDHSTGNSGLVAVF